MTGWWPFFRTGRNRWGLGQIRSRQYHPISACPVCVRRAMVEPSLPLSGAGGVSGPRYRREGV